MPCNELPLERFFRSISGTIGKSVDTPAVVLNIVVSIAGSKSLTIVDRGSCASKYASCTAGRLPAAWAGDLHIGRPVVICGTKKGLPSLAVCADIYCLESLAVSTGSGWP